MTARHLATYAIAALGLVGFGVHERTAIPSIVDAADLSFWDVALSIVGSGHVLTFWITPIALALTASVVAGGPRSEELVRRPSRTDWAVSRQKRAAGHVAALLVLHGVVAVTLSADLAFSWAWPSAASDLLQIRPSLERVLPLPFMVLVVYLLATLVTIVGLASVVCLVAAFGSRARAPAIVAAALAVWSMITFQVPLSVLGYLAPATYALPSRGLLYYPFAPLAGTLILVAVLVLLSSTLRAREVAHARRI